MKYYDILGVDSEASQAELQAAYKQRVKETHPDQSDHPNAAQQFMQVQEAYDVLGDPEQRANYDQYGVSGTDSTTGKTGGASQSTAAADADGVGWRAHTRGSDGADQMWDGVSNRTDKPPRVGDTPQSPVKRAGGTVAAGVSGGILGVVTIAYPLSWLQGNSFTLLLLVVCTGIFVAVIASIERVLGTHRQLLSS